MKSEEENIKNEKIENDKSKNETTKNENTQNEATNNNGKEKDSNAKHGLYRQLIHNMVVGVAEGFKKSLTINGVGYKAIMKGNDVELSLGYSHPILVKAEEGITLSCDKNTITVSGIDKEQVGQFASRIRDLRPVEPYHAYGVYYSDEVVRRKEIKIGKK